MIRSWWREDEETTRRELKNQSLKMQILCDGLERMKSHELSGHDPVVIY